ncbi:MAG: outer membrane beta-barrel protein [Bacteroidetes bacterium]|nr:outer membrane beta-barrel protein [Bacteroidota bacterium]
MKRILLSLLLLGVCAAVHAQQYDLKGTIVDKAGKPLLYTSVALLHPMDSTLAFFGVSNENGFFDVRGIAHGDYLLQVALMGFKTYYRTVTVPMTKGDNIGDIVLQEADVKLNEVQVNGEKIPFMLKGDTVEYNAGAYKVKPDASVEDLLKKLPGVQVDAAGNIKAQGKDVQRVTVDGKDFFGNDPKVATKNLPADAINKVQVYDRHSDQSVFSGIDDGERDKTINLTLKDNKKHGYFGDVQAGYGTDNHYKFNGRINKFGKKTQFSALGMLNNINEFGFTFSDYLNFSGGMRGLMDGSGGISMNINSNMPVNFGQPVAGLITSGAGGLNFNYEPRDNNRFNISYMGNGAGKKLDEQTNTKNFTDNGSFVKDDNSNAHSEDWGHRLNFSWKNQLDSTRQLLLNGGAELTNSSTRRDLMSSTYVRDVIFNRLTSLTNDNANGLGANANAVYTKKYNGGWPVAKVFASGNYERTLTKTQWNNATTYFDSLSLPFYDNQYQDNRNEKVSYSAGASIVRRLGRGYYLEPQLELGNNTDHLTRTQGAMPREAGIIDSLSPDYDRTFAWAKPGLSFRKSTNKIQFNATVNGEIAALQSALPGTTGQSRNYFYLLPSAMLQDEYRQGRHLGISYNSSVTAPNARQMLPVANTSDPLYVTTGNRNLRPEYSHVFNINWLRFDQFSMTSIFANLTLRYTHDKINWSRSVNAGLGQTATLVNVPDDYDLRGRVEYSTPIRVLGIDINASFDEQYNKGLNIVNAVYNRNNTFTHGFELDINNRKKEHWDASVTGFIKLSDANYSLEKSLNNTFYNYGGNAMMSYRPNDHWYFMMSGDLDIYDGKSFDNIVTIPLLKAEASYYFLKAKRGVLTLNGFDLLDKNTGLTRSSQLNYLIEKQSNIIGRYFMLSFKYRLSRTGNPNPGAIEIKMGQ